MGEQVLTHAGSATLIGKRPAPAQRVYNLEVKELHNFLVGNQGALVHNACVSGEPCDFLWQGIKHQGGETPLEHIMIRHTAKNAPAGKSYFNAVFDDDGPAIQNMINEAVQDWAKFEKGEGTFVDEVFFPGSKRTQILVDFSTRKGEFGIDSSDFIGIATDGDPINTIRFTLTEDLKVYNAFPSKTVQ